MALTALLGLIVGVILALTGAGGGILAVPLLLFGLGISVAEAGPIGLLAVGMAAAVGAGMGLRAGTVRYKAALLMAAAGIVCSPAGLWLAHRLPDRPLTLLFAMVLFYVATRVWRRTLPARPGRCFKAPPCILDAQRGKLNWTGPCAWALALAGLVAGGLSGLLGVGGGFVMVPALQRYSNLSAQSVLATSLAVIALVSLAGVATSSLAGHVQWTIAAPFCAGALAGMLAGQQVAARLAGPYLQRGFAVVCALVALGLFIKGLR
ncbi:sulfite exporter TauE/SafE family protein [Pseudomonas sp. KNUC1026]|uniref:sulfite exporter TauE/SafE family protein n=1 Tax=Pseudomonas sp. KNUC1026 TaxID=2893890 RepID=UPI001F3F9ABF|nr:sulfite exporter TauE/SafE family protein [Pseudomonas sp. KNUC1026]UFH50466.1 sulfite exporter TauE/SafE family protein [Pseudomonas sp. KNUC1026]